MVVVSETPSWSVVVVGCFAVKFLLIPCYFSTDFDVHRNWLSITNKLPISQWYTDSTSEWTLDYPPFFAWFEYGLSRIAEYFDSAMLNVQSEPYRSESAVRFQRVTVIFSDIWYLLACIRMAKFIQKSSSFPVGRSGAVFGVTSVLLICNVGLLLVDNIHFQYNGFLSGFLLLSIVSVLEERYICGTFWYLVLVNFKHIYLYLAPAYLAVYLRNFCVTDRSRRTNLLRLLKSVSLRRTMYLLLTMIGVFAVSFGPVLYYGQLRVVMSRLFPFKRGLTHAYWTPNVWALYNCADFALYHGLKLLNFIDSSTPKPQYTSGLVQEYSHVVLPSISPLCTFVLTLIFMFPFCLILTLSLKTADSFLRLLTHCAFLSYLFGWHVHEKAILLITIPLALLAVRNFRYAKPFLLLATTGHFSLFPLFFSRFESPIKYISVVLYSLFAIVGLGQIYKGEVPSNRWCVRFLTAKETLYLAGLVPLELYCNGLHFVFGVDAKAPFLPLMATSVYCAVGVVYCWVHLTWVFVCEELAVDVWWYKKVWAKEQNRLKSRLVTANTERWQNIVEDESKRAERERELRYVGGLDISTPDGDPLNACVCLTVLKYPEMKVVHSEYSAVVIDKPYVAGFLAFREVGPMVGLVEKVRRERPEVEPQVLMVDGNGILHPRGFGLASHVGVLLDIPCIGVAKNLHLVGGLVRDIRRYERELISVGQTIPLKDALEQVIGCALKPTAESKNPIYISVGHKISLESAVSLVIQCSEYRVPEPIRQADQLSRKMVQLWF